MHFADRTRLKAPIPNETPPSKCLWFGPLKEVSDWTMALSSLRENYDVMNSITMFEKQIENV